jgi:hypothetical protein
MKIPRRLPFLLVLLLALSGSPAAFAIDGLSAPPSSESQSSQSSPSETYYESVIGSGSLEDLESPGGGLPAEIAVVDAEGSVIYGEVSNGSEIGWEVSVQVDERDHERVDAVYDLVLVLPLPINSQGKGIFRPRQFGIDVREGTPANSVAFVYGGEKLVLKRNVGLERTWLPDLVGSGDVPDLSGTGYAFTLWDTVVRYDSGHGPRVQGHGTLQYTTDANVTAPDASDPRFAAYVITWIPTLDPSIPPFGIRVDVQAPAE